MEPTLEEQTQVNNEFNEKVAWTVQQLSNLETELKFELKESKGLLTPADSLDIMRQASIKFAKQDAKTLKVVDQPYAMDDSFLILSKEHMKNLSIIQDDTYSELSNVSGSPAVEKSISPKGGVPSYKKFA